MDGALFDRITKILVERTPRREAARTLAGGGLATLAARLGFDVTSAKRRQRKKKKKKIACRERRETCGGKKRCCGDPALVACREFPWDRCTILAGLHCCGLEGASCQQSNDAGRHCDCCPDLYCHADGRCKETPT